MSAMHRLCEHVATLYGNPSPSHAAACSDAEAHGRPAFWPATKWDETTVERVAWFATYSGELHQALDRFSDEPRKEIIDNLVPLNHKAVLQLRMAYMSINEYPPLPSLHARIERR